MTTRKLSQGDRFVNLLDCMVEVVNSIGPEIGTINEIGREIELMPKRKWGIFPNPAFRKKKEEYERRVIPLREKTREKVLKFYRKVEGTDPKVTTYFSNISFPCLIGKVMVEPPTSGENIMELWGLLEYFEAPTNPIVRVHLARPLETRDRSEVLSKIMEAKDFWQNCEYQLDLRKKGRFSGLEKFLENEWNYFLGNLLSGKSRGTANEMELRLKRITNLKTSLEHDFSSIAELDMKFVAIPGDTIENEIHYELSLERSPSGDKISRHRLPEKEKKGLTDIINKFSDS